MPRLIVELLNKSNKFNDKILSIIGMVGGEIVSTYSETHCSTSLEYAGTFSTGIVTGSGSTGGGGGTAGGYTPTNQGCDCPQTCPVCGKCIDLLKNAPLPGTVTNTTVLANCVYCTGHQEPATTVVKIINTNDLDPKQIKMLEIALKNFINSHCLAKSIYDYLANSGCKLNVALNDYGAPAAYNAQTKTIYFRDNAAISEANLKEELFHALQDFYYSGGIAQYSSTGKVNIEFEAKLFKDVMQYACCDAFNIGNSPQSVKDDYYFWVQSIGGDPNIISDVDYQYWLGLFNQYTPAYSSSATSNLNSPSLLKSIMLHCLNQ